MDEKQQQRPEQPTFQFDIMQFLRVLYEGLVLVIILTVIFGVGAYFYTTMFTKDTYTSKGTIYVNSTNETTETQTTTQQGISGSNIDISRKVSTTYIAILESTSFLTEVSEELDGIYGVGSLRGILDIQQVDNTELISISATTGSAEDSNKIVSAVIKRAPAKLISIYEAGRVRTLDDASLPENPNAKETVRNTAIGALAGFVIAAAILFIRRIFDRRIRTIEEIEKRYEISILGELPL